MIEVRGLTKRYGDRTAVDDLTFRVEPGAVTGFLGPNGSGKTTTARVLLGLSQQDSGTAAEHVRWLAAANRLPARRADHVLAQVGLATVARRRTGGFSLGMRQRLGIAAALLGDPPVLLFDEPVNGLDPEGIRWFRGFARELAARGRAVFVSSHLMSELEDTADHLVVIGRGRLVADTGVGELLAAASGDRVVVRTPQRSETMTVLAGAGGTVTESGQDALTVSGLPAARIADLAAERGLRLYELSPYRASLEEAFMELTRDAVEYRAGRDGEV